jgi:uncharacterized protein YukE
MADYGKKTVILSCDPATLGDIGLDNKYVRQNNVVSLKLYRQRPSAHGCTSCDMLRPMRFTSSNQFPGHIYATTTRQTAHGATSFLNANARMASLLPAAMRMGSLQKDCADALPPMFSDCDVLSFEDGQLVLATPTSAVAAKLKQQLPKLQAALQKRGWQINNIRLKVQVTRSIAPVVHTRQLEFPPSAVSAFAELGDALPDTPQNATLIKAIKAMAARRR